MGERHLNERDDRPHSRACDGVDDEHEQRTQAVGRFHDPVHHVLLDGDGQRHEYEDEPEPRPHQLSGTAEGIAHLAVLPDDDGTDETEERVEGNAGNDQEDEEYPGAQREEKVRDEQPPVRQRPQDIPELRSGGALLGGRHDVVEQTGEERGAEQRRARGHQHDGRQQARAVAGSVGDLVDEDVEERGDAEQDDGRARYQPEVAPQHSERAGEDGTRPDYRLLVGPCLRHRRSVAITRRAGSA
ncbi:MAG TPA: hypothetical protein VGK05_09795 [Acidimicrobiia bacterium]